jgi:hypothetical protein
MTKPQLKIYSKTAPKSLPGRFHTCAVFSSNTKTYYTELDIDDYYNTRTELEQLGYKALPSSSKEIESSIYTIFQEV